jgi:ABC-type multidrug transport system permease subunit
MIAVIVGSMIAVQYSGMMTPVADLDGASYAIAHLFPAMYYTTIIEGVFLKSAGLAQVWREVGILAVYSAASLALAHALFHKRTRS